MCAHLLLIVEPFVCNLLENLIAEKGHGRDECTLQRAAQDRRRREALPKMDRQDEDRRHDGHQPQHKRDRPLGLESGQLFEKQAHHIDESHKENELRDDHFNP